jgi:dynein heavy chain
MAKAYCKEKKDEDNKKPNEGPLAFLGLQRKSVDEEGEKKEENGETEKGENGETEKEDGEVEKVEDGEAEKGEGGKTKEDEEKMDDDKETEEAMEVEESSTPMEDTNKEASSPKQSEEQTEKETDKRAENEAENVAEGKNESQTQVNHIQKFSDHLNTRNITRKPNFSIDRPFVRRKKLSCFQI